MFKKLFYRSCALVSEVEDTLHHLYRWHRTRLTHPHDRVLDMYALEDRVLFNIAPIMNVAALQAAAAGTGTGVGQDLQVSAMPAPDQNLVAVQQVHAGQETQQSSQNSDNLDNKSISSLSSQIKDQGKASNTDGTGDDRHVDFALIDDSLQNLDQLMRSLDSKVEVYLYDHRHESPTDVLNTVYDWAKSNHAEIDTLSIISHGASGSFVLGNQWLSSSNLGQSAEAWQRLGAVMAPSGNIDIFGCNVADGTSGRDLINNIGRLSGATVFASVNDTGYRGDWVLEAASTTGNASAWHNPLDTQIVGQWRYELAPGITVTPTSALTTSEAGGTATFTVALDAAPVGENAYVTIGISSSDTTEGVVSVNSLTFTSANWNVAQTVTVTGVNDTLVDGNIAYTILTAPAVSNDPLYNNMNADDVSLTNIDNGYNTIYVTTTNDTINGTITSIAALYANPGADGISLREAITAANNTPNGLGGPDRIYFNILGSGVHTIAPTTELPYITNPVIIDGYTQPAASPNALAVGNNAVLQIEINGAATTDVSGLSLASGSSGSTISGLVINSFDVTAINILSDNNTIAGNFIGTNADGTAVQGNSHGNSYGIYILNGQYNTIGGTTAAARNVISGNTTEGIYLFNAMVTTITGNYIGTNAAGTAAIGNNIGIYSYLASNTVIGGTTAGAGNIVSGNTNCGIHLDSCGSGNVIQGNYIGANAAGTGGIANNTGIMVNNTAGLVIGGSTTAAGNVICHNTGIGVNISGNSSGVRVWGNSIYSNGGLGINLVGNDLPNNVTPNDPGDIDTGPNNLQNFPELTGAAIYGNNFTVRGTLNSTASTTGINFRIEIFANTVADSSGYGEGQRLLGTFDVATDPSGNVNFSHVFNNVAVADGEQISATATNLTTNCTSEFAYSIPAVTPGINVTLTSAPTTTEAGGKAYFTVALAIAPTADVTISLRTSDATEGTIDKTSLTFTTGNWSTPQTVTVTGKDDTYIDGNVAYTIFTDPAVSVDPNYSGLDAADVTLTNNDNDTYNIITVTTNDDLVDGDVRTIADLYNTPGGTGISLREAITAANNTPNGTGGPDRIFFNLPDGSHTINLIYTNPEGLPHITQPVIIDGRSDSHYAGTPIIEINGLASNFVGLWLDVGSDGSTIRDLVINRNGWEGIRVDSNDNTIAGCYVGTDVTGTSALANGTRGANALWILGNNNTIGGTIAADRNVISGNTRSGIWLSGVNNTVQGNYLGTDYTGTIGIANGWDGVTVSGSNNLIGGTGAGMDNLIAHNTNYGVAVVDGCTGNRILGNSIYGHGSIGIDLRPSDGVTPNDPGDTDTGGNNLQNFPVLSTATANSTQVYITGSLNSIAGTNYRLEFFANNTSVGPDSTGYGEGQRYLGSANVTTDADGNVAFAATLTAAVAEGEYISATATNLTTNDTSEFARDVQAHTAGINITSTPGLTTSESGGLAQFTVKLNAVPSSNVIVLLASSDTSEGTVSPASLTFTTADPAAANYWNKPQTVTVTGVDDPYDDGDIAYTVNVSIDAAHSAPEYAGLSAQNVPLTNLDNELAGVNVNPVGTLITTETGEGNTTTFTVALNCQPTADVKLNLSSSNTTEGTLSCDTLTFTTADPTAANYWNKPQTVTVTGVNDSIAGNVDYSISISVDVAHSAPEYAGVLTQNIQARNTNVDDTYSTILVDTISNTNDTGLNPNTMTIADLYNHKGTDGKISLREAIIAANNTPNVIGIDHIYFNLPFGSQLEVASQLPDISTPMYIDGNNGSGSGTPSIILHGSASIIGLNITCIGTSSSEGATVRGLVINNFGNNGVLLAGNYNKVVGCYVGTDVTGTTAVGNTYSTWTEAIRITGNYNTVGGTTIADRNVISGNLHAGVWIPGSYNNVLGNYVGVDATGNNALPNRGSGVGTQVGSVYNVISGNVISCNGYYNNGQRYMGVENDGNYTTISNNIVGLSASGALMTWTSYDGKVFVGNVNNGIFLRGSYNTITGNVVSGNTNHGIATNSGSNSQYNLISGNRCGTNLAGTAAIPNTIDGIRLETSHYNTITGNLVSGNRYGIFLNNACLSNTISGNYVGTNLAGTAAIPNTLSGIILNNGPSSTMVTGNLASGNGNNGIYIINSPNNTVRGNIIGLNAAGTAGIPNGYSGICIRGANGKNNVIGGTDPSYGNLIAYNAYYGVRVDTSSATGNQILGNSIYKNGRIGIDLTNTSGDPVGDGVTPNDLGDADTGGNNLQNYPVLNTATILGTQLNITGSLNSLASTSFRIEFFANAPGSIDIYDQYLGNYYGEGQTFIGFVNVTTNASGDVISVGDSSGTATMAGTNTFAVTFTKPVADGDYISATATKIVGATYTDTSEFCQSKAAHIPGVTVTPTSGLITSEFGTTATFTVVLNAAPTADVTIAITSSDITEGLVSSASSPTPGTSLTLAFTTANWNTPQTVTVTGVDDTEEDGAVPYTIVTGNTSSTDTLYINLPVADVSVTNVDNDSAGFAVIPASGLTTTETGGSASFQVVLNKQPTSSVTLNFSSSNPYAGTVSPATSSLTFTTANWNVAKTVTVIGANNDIYGDINYTIDMTVDPSSAPEYRSAYAPSVSVRDIDNDTYSTIFVDTNSDVNDTGLDPATMTIAQLYNHKGTDGKISLREAIIAANNSANGPGGPDRIYFNLPVDLRQITVSSLLPDISTPMIIDSTNGSYNPNTPITPIINLYGSANIIGLSISSSGASASVPGSTIRGLAINNFGNEAIIISGNYNTVAGCYIGTDVTGTSAVANGYSSWFNAIAVNGNFNTIGGANTADRNVVSGNTHHGIWITGDDNVVRGNYLGVDVTGNVGLGNGCSGVGTDGTILAERNVISNNVISGNGLLSNQPWSNLEIRGTYTVITGNYIGTNAAGTAAIGNSNGYNIDGITVYGNYNTIGGTTAAARNIVSGDNYGIYLYYCSNNTVQGNYIGLNAAGNTKIGNLSWGIDVYCGNNNLIGGTTPEARNVVSGSGQAGIAISTYGGTASASNNIIEGNYIGTFADGTGSVATSGNLKDGIDLRGGSLALTNNTIGGIDPNASNLIAYNANCGVRVDVNTATGNPILGNSIHDNALLGINLTTSLTPAADGTVTLNTTSTAGGNNLQHFPVLATATIRGTQVRISGSLNSAADASYRIEFFANSSPNTTGYGEGQRYLGYANVTTDASGNVISVSDSSGTGTMITGTNNFAVTLTATVADGESISATATKFTTGTPNTYTDTSEFAQDQVAHTAEITITPTSDVTLTTSEDGTTSQISVVLHAAPAADVRVEVSVEVSSNNTSEGMIVTNEGMVPATYLTFTPANWNQPQTVTVTGVMDYSTDEIVPVPYTVTIHNAQSSDAMYNGSSGAVFSANNIDHVNLAPVITVPETQTVNSFVVFSSLTENAIRVEDVDAGTNPLCVQLVASNGNLTLGSTTDLTFHVGNGVRNGTMEFVGSSIAVNAALEGMKFTPTISNGNIQITVSDQGFSGSGNAKTGMANVGIEALTPQAPSAPRRYCPCHSLLLPRSPRYPL